MPRKPAAPDAPLSPKAQRAANLAALREGYGSDDSYVAQKVMQGLALDTEKDSLYERIDANRTLLRTFVTSGDLAAADCELLYPTKKPKNDDAEEAAS